MNVLFVVSHLKDWPVAIPGVEVVPARTYLHDPAYADRPGIRVFNLCQSYRYQGRGYYVSLLAEARGHQPLPDVKAIEDVQEGRLAVQLAEGLGERIDEALADVEEDRLELRMYFGRDLHRRYDGLCGLLFNLLQIPLLCVHFVRDRLRWKVERVHVLKMAEIPPQERAQLARAAQECLHGHRTAFIEPAAQRPRLAVLYDREAHEVPSNPQAMRHFLEAAEMAGMRPELIGRDDIGRLPEFDALFIRDTTAVNHYTYQFSRAAALAGMTVMDDPDSILKCSNKIYLNELLGRHGIAMPKTLTVHRDNVRDIVPTLGLPCILKRPDGAFSTGVVKASSEDEVMQWAMEMLEYSDLVLAQEYLPTDYDWRIGVLDRKPLFACRYYMVPGHWQIIRHEEGREGYSEGRTEAVAIEDAPPQVIETALAACNLIGDGFYGVDLKQRGQHCYIIEINDNPNVDAGNEDGFLQERLYREVMEVFRARIARRKESVRA